MAEIDGGLAGEKNTAACGPALQSARTGGRAGAGRLGESRVGSSEIGHSCAAVELAPGAGTGGSIELQPLIGQRIRPEKQALTLPRQTYLEVRCYRNADDRLSTASASAGRADRYCPS